jgi:hypothetical protein
MREPASPDARRLMQTGGTTFSVASKPARTTITAALLSQ